MVNQLLTQSFYRIPWSLLKVLFPQYPAKWLMFSVTVLQSFLCISLCKYCTKTRIKGHCAMVPLHEITVLTAPAVKTLVRSRFTVLFCSVWAKSNQLNTYLRNIFLLLHYVTCVSQWEEWVTAAAVRSFHLPANPPGNCMRGKAGGRGGVRMFTSSYLLVSAVVMAMSGGVRSGRVVGRDGTVTTSDSGLRSQ